MSRGPIGDFATGYSSDPDISLHQDDKFAGSNMHINQQNTLANLDKLIS